MAEVKLYVFKGCVGANTHYSYTCESPSGEIFIESASRYEFSRELKRRIEEIHKIPAAALVSFELPRKYPIEWFPTEKSPRRYILLSQSEQNDLWSLLH